MTSPSAFWVPSPCCRASKTFPFFMVILIPSPYFGGYKFHPLILDIPSSFLFLSGINCIPLFSGFEFYTLLLELKVPSTFFQDIDLHFCVLVVSCSIIMFSRSELHPVVHILNSSHFWSGYWVQFHCFGGFQFYLLDLRVDIPAHCSPDTKCHPLFLRFLGSILFFWGFQIPFHFFLVVSSSIPLGSGIPSSFPLF